MALDIGWVSWYIRKALFLIGIRTEGTWANKRNGRHLLSLCILSRPSWEMGYTVFCQWAVSGNYGLHCRLRALSLCLLTLCSTVLDRKHGCLAWASKEYYRYASESEFGHCWDLKHTNTWKSQNIPNVKRCTCLSESIVAAEQLSSHMLWVFVIVVRY